MRGDRRRVLQRRTGDLGRVDDAGLDQVGQLAGRRVEADRALGGLDLTHDDRAFEAGVVGDVAAGSDERLPHGAGTGRLVAFERLDDLGDRRRGPG